MVCISDKIKGCLIAGAAGDALGYEVEFSTLPSIIRRHGAGGIRSFKLNHRSQALVSDDTQMTLFTAAGLLSGLGDIADDSEELIARVLEKGVATAYLEWYDTQTETAPKLENGTMMPHTTWLWERPELYSARAPGCTCTASLADMRRGMAPSNDSKGCGGIMRAAPVGLLAAICAAQGRPLLQRERWAELAVATARITHLHPLGFLPAALLSDIVYQSVPLSADECVKYFEDIIQGSLAVIDLIFKGQYVRHKNTLKEFTEAALKLARKNIADSEAIGRLGEGWTGDEAWAIAVYCAAKHVDNVEEALIAAVNHGGDSDSTASVTGNIVGAMFGYDRLLARNILCPKGKQLNDVLELHDIIIAIADKLAAADVKKRRNMKHDYCAL